MKVGATGTAVMTVTDDDTAEAMGSGDVNVVATPCLVALAEEATVNAVMVDDESVSVGTRVEIDHLRPSHIGAEIVARATLEEVNGRDLHFSVDVEEADKVIARAIVTRVVVDRARFAQSGDD